MMRNTTHQISLITPVKMKTLSYLLKKYKKSCFKLLPDWETKIHRFIKLSTLSLKTRTLKIIKMETSKKMIWTIKSLRTKICWSKVSKIQINPKMKICLQQCKKKKQRINSSKHWKNKKMLSNNKEMKMTFSQSKASWKSKRTINKNNLKINLKNSWKRWSLRVKNWSRVSGKIHRKWTKQTCFWETIFWTKSGWVNILASIRLKVNFKISTKRMKNVV